MKYGKAATAFFIFVFLFGALYVWAQTRSALEVVLENETPSKHVGAAAFADATDPNDLLPDIVPLPPRDMQIQTTEDGRVLLLFSTTYYNRGRGPLELRIDDETTNVSADIERDVMQRVYLKDGEYRDKPVGTFLWHQEHLHYHFSDFIEYDLEPEDAPEHKGLEGSLVKSTFCVRDVSRVELELPEREEEAVYKICSKRLQGVSVGWGDTYYYNYPAQNLDITDLASGIYRLTFRTNPENIIEEIRYDNNTSSTLIKIDMEAKTVEVLEELPQDTPAVEHVHLDDPFGI